MEIFEILIPWKEDSKKPLVLSLRDNQRQVI